MIINFVPRYYNIRAEMCPELYKKMRKLAKDLSLNEKEILGMVLERGIQAVAKEASEIEEYDPSHYIQNEYYGDEEEE